MNKWATGSTAEKLYCQKLEADGWMTRRWNKSRFGEQDVFGCDIIAKRAGETLWIQVKSRTGRKPEKSKKVIDNLKHLVSHCSDHERVLLVLYRRDTKEWWETEVI